MGDTIFLLGAGASRDAGLPLMADLTTGFREALAGDPTAAALLEVYDAAVAATAGPLGSPNIERVLQLLADVAALKTTAGAVVEAWANPFGVSAEGLQELAELTRDYIRKVLAEAVANQRSDYLHGIIEPGEDGALDVFTLNYDRLLENMAIRYEIRYTTGFAESWNPALFGLPDLRLKIHKLHGSVDWYRLVSRNVVYAGGREHPAFPGEPSTEVLLYPTRGKTAFADPFATLVARFNEALSKARYCVAIGYSFRDAHIRRIVLDRLATNRELQLIVVVPEPEEILNVPADDPDEPTFLGVAHRVSGLAVQAKVALENRLVRSRRNEIEYADKLLRDAFLKMAEREFDAASQALLSAVDYCQAYKLPHKPAEALRYQFGADMRESISRQMSSRVASTVRSLRLEDGVSWQLLGPADFTNSVASLAHLWLIATSLNLQEPATEARGHLKAVAHQLTRGILFRRDRENICWGDTRHSRGGQLDMVAREAAARALLDGLTKLPPRTGLLLAGPESVTASEYTEFLAGLRILLNVLALVRQDGVQALVINGREVWASNNAAWPQRSAAWSPGLLTSRFAEVWLDPAQRHAWRAG